MSPTKERPATKTIATNREARHEYFVLEALETGVELKGTEVTYRSIPLPSSTRTTI